MRSRSVSKSRSAWSKHPLGNVRKPQRKGRSYRYAKKEYPMKAKNKILTGTFLILIGGAAVAATLPPGFSESIVASGLSNPTAMEFAPDGRLFVCQQAGQLRVVKNSS